MTPALALLLAVLALPAVVGWWICFRHLRRWLLDRRLERELTQDIARYNAELVSLAAIRGLQKRRGQVLRMVPRGAKRA